MNLSVRQDCLLALRVLAVTRRGNTKGPLLSAACTFQGSGLFSGPYGCCRLCEPTSLSALCTGSSQPWLLTLKIAQALWVGLAGDLQVFVFSSFFFLTYMMENGSPPRMVGGGEGGTWKKETNRTDFLKSVPTWVFSPLKTQQAELIDFNYID